MVSLIPDSKLEVAIVTITTAVDRGSLRCDTLRDYLFSVSKMGVERSFCLFMNSSRLSLPSHFYYNSHYWHNFNANYLFK